MDNDVSPSNCNNDDRFPTLSSPLISKRSIFSPLPETNSSSTEAENTFPNFASLYHSVLSDENVTYSPSIMSPPSSTQSAPCTDNAMATERRLYQARLIIESHLYQELLNRYGIALNCLHDLTRIADALREENELLRLANEDLTRSLSSLSSQASLLRNLTVSSSPLSLIDDLRRVSFETSSGKENHHDIPTDVVFSNNSPTSVIETNRLQRTGLNRVSMPKSISVRSTGYLKMNEPADINNAGPSRAPNRSQVPNQPVDPARRVYVKPEGNAVEMEVYNQGMYKTELCKKWQETGACPYGEQCQFAHGLSELRPVLRHPRYKTEVCRMVLAGVSCPYGHRCHFRHSTAERERLMGPR